MERIELYDRYINHQLSKDECKEFDARLESDKDFASDFKVYLFTVNGICREVHQDNIDFGVALKNLSKEQLCNIIGDKAESPVKPKILHFKPWMWQVASVAAIFVIVFGMFFNIEKNARYAVDNAIYTCADIAPDLVRAGGKPIDITPMTQDELKTKLSELESL